MQEYFGVLGCRTWKEGMSIAELQERGCDMDRLLRDILLRARGSKLWPDRGGWIGRIGGLDGWGGGGIWARG